MPTHVAVRDRRIGAAESLAYEAVLRAKIVQLCAVLSRAALPGVVSIYNGADDLLLRPPSPPGTDARTGDDGVAFIIGYRVSALVLDV